MFVPTQSQDAAPQPDKKLASASQHLESPPFTLPLQLSANPESCSTAQMNSQHADEDSQATQIEELDEPPGKLLCDRSNGIPAESQTTCSSEGSTSDMAAKTCSESAEKTCLNVQPVNVKEAGSADMVSCSQQKFDSCDVTVNSCVEETPPDTTRCCVASQSMICAATAVNVRSFTQKEETSGSQCVETSSQKCVAVGDSQTGKGMMDEHEEEVMEEESTVGGGASGLALVLSQSQLLSPEPMEEDDEDRGEGSVVVVTDSVRDSQIVQKDGTLQAKTNSSQPLTGPESVSTNGHEPQVPAKKGHVASDRLSQSQKAGPEGELKDKSLSDSSGGEINFLFPVVPCQLLRSRRES